VRHGSISHATSLPNGQHSHSGGQPCEKSVYQQVSSTGGAQCGKFPNINARYVPDEHGSLPTLPPVAPAQGASAAHWNESEWSKADIQQVVEENVMLTWGPSRPAKDLPHIVNSDGCFLIDSDGNRLLDFTSQAVCSNFGYDISPDIVEAVTNQIKTNMYVYSGMGIVPVRAKLAKLLRETLPGDITGFLFPSGGAEANEAAIRMARRYTGRHKILTQYRSYHGGAAASLGATGDFRRGFAETGVTGFVKIFNPQPFGFNWGTSDEMVCTRSLQALEEQILLEGPGTIAAIMLESVVGAGGVLVPPDGYMQGVRALCDKYDVLLILDEVMVGFGRTGKMWAFEHFEGVVPDMITSAKGLTGSIMPMSMLACREKIRQFFLDNALGWGSTYHAHPVAMACAYECVKFTIKEDLPGKAKALEPVMMEELQGLVDRHVSVKQGRAIGLFGCADLQADESGRDIQKPGAASPPHVAEFRSAMRRHGIISLFRPPLLHVTPPLVISEELLRDGFKRMDAALCELDGNLADAPPSSSMSGAFDAGAL